MVNLTFIWRKPMKLQDVKAGDKLIADAGFSCMPEGPAIVEVDPKGQLYIRCQNGCHYLDSMTDFTDGVTLVGLSRSN